MPQDYSKREIDLQINALKDHIKDSHRVIDEKLDRILDQTTRTNGRVSKLENWRSWATGYGIAISPILAWLSYQTINHLIP